jgi:hypothetical protein
VVSGYNCGVTLDTFLIPKTTITAKGEGSPIEVAASRIFLLTLEITEIVEQESIDVGVSGSTDGQTWSASPLISFAQKFYRGESNLLLNLQEQPEIRMVRARWNVNRWGRGSEQPMFQISLRIREVPDHMLESIKASTAS